MKKGTFGTLYSEHVKPMSKDESLVCQHLYMASVLAFNKDGSKKRDQPKDGVEAWLDEQLGSINRELLNRLI